MRRMWEVGDPRVAASCHVPITRHLNFVACWRVCVVSNHRRFMAAHTNNFPKLHNAAWPGIVGKGPDSEPPIDLDTMLDLTAAANVDGVRFDGVDLFLFDPHVSIDSSDDDLKRLAERVSSRNLMIGSVVAPVWPPTDGGSAMGGARRTEEICRPSPKGRADCQQAHGAWRAAVWRDSYRFGGES